MAGRTLTDELMAMVAERDATIARLVSMVAGRDTTIATSPLSSPITAKRVETEVDQDFSLVVDIGKHFRVYKAGIDWLRHFGFRDVEVEGRSMGASFGPKTDTRLIGMLLSRVSADTACVEAGVWNKVILYNKAGHEQHVLLQARREPVPDDEGELDVPRVRLYMHMAGRDGAQPKQYAHSRPLQHVPRFTHTQDDEHDVALVVDACKPFLVDEVDAKWLQLLQFDRSEVEGRSVSICFGPETDTKAFDALVRQVAARMIEVGTLSQLKLYDKSGQEHCVSMQVRRVLEEQNNKEVQRLRLLMRVRDNTSTKSVATVTLSSEEPYLVLDNNEALLEQFHIPTATMLRTQGISLIFGPQTDGRKWKSLINHALSGITKSCTLTTYNVTGDEVLAKVTMRPIKLVAGIAAVDTVHPLKLVASFEPLPPDAESGHRAGADAARSDSHCSSSTAACSRSFSTCSTDHPTQELCNAFNVHLKAMLMHNRYNLHTRSLRSLPSDQRTAVCAKEELVALTTAAKHSNSYTFGARRRAEHCLSDIVSPRDRDSCENSSVAESADSCWEEGFWGD